METKRYCVQILRVLEIEVDATDDLQAEKEAARMLGLEGNEIAILVQDEEHEDFGDGGALANEDNVINWQYAKDNFHTLDSDWVT